MTYADDQTLKRDITITENTTWTAAWQFTSNGAAFFTTTSLVKAQVRDRAGGALLHQFNAGLTDEGVVVLTVTPNESVLWKWIDGWFDVLITKPGGGQFRLVEGRVRVSKAVSR